MAEDSFPWDGYSTGDCGPYSADSWDDLYRYLFTQDQQVTQGPLKGVGDELAVSGTSSPVSVAAGAAVVNGKFYKNTAAADVAIPTPSGATRIDRIVLRADYSAQTVRMARKAAAEGTGNAPTLTQDDGVTWEISLAQVSITTAGVITVTDERDFCHFATKVANSQLDDDCKRIPGEIVMMYVDSLSGKNPVKDSVTYENWSLCDGGTYNGYVTPDMRDKFVVGAGSTYAQGDNGGAATAAHTHAYGTLSTDTVANHSHSYGTLGTSTAANHAHTISNAGAEYYLIPDGESFRQAANQTHNHGGNTGNAGNHSHTVTSGATGNSGSHSHTLTGGATGSTAPATLPPYRALYFFMYCPA